MRRLITGLLALVFIAAVAGSVYIAGQFLAPATPSAAPAPTPHPTARVVPSPTAQARPIVCRVGRTAPRHISSGSLTLANDPLTVRGGGAICLEAFTLPHAMVTFTVFGTSKSAPADANGRIGLRFTAPAVDAPSKVVYLCRVLLAGASVTAGDLEGRERFRVVP